MSFKLFQGGSQLSLVYSLFLYFFISLFILCFALLVYSLCICLVIYLTSPPGCDSEINCTNTGRKRRFSKNLRVKFRKEISRTIWNFSVCAIGESSMKKLFRIRSMCMTRYLLTIPIITLNFSDTPTLQGRIRIASVFYLLF